MSFTSAEFLILAAGMVLVVNAAPRRAYRQIFLAIGNAFFLASFLPNWSSLACLAAFALAGYAMARLAQRGTFGSHPGWWIGAYLGVTLGAFLVIKKYTLIGLVLGSQSPILGHGVWIIGLSYIYFKQIHVVVDAQGGVLGDTLDLPTYLNYLLSFHTLLAGPIMRYEDYHRQLTEADERRLRRGDVLDGVNRTVNGYLKKYVLAEFVLRRLMDQLDPTQSAGMAVARLYVFALWVYTDFSGYCDIVIGIGSLMGIRPPENFRRPFFSRNLIEFWSRWHMSLSEWVRTYIFTPASKALVVRWGPKHLLAVGIIAYLASMTVIGLWHGTTVPWALWGVYHGLGITACKLYETWLKRRWGQKAYKGYMRSRLAGAVGTVVCFHFFVSSVVFIDDRSWRAVTGLFS